MLEHAVIIESVENLAPLPASATRLAAILSGDDWAIGDLVDVVAFDPALTTKILASGLPLRIDRTASIPDCSFITMSIVIASGFSSWNLSTASLPLSASPTTS